MTVCDPTLDYDKQNGIKREPGHDYNKKDPRNIRALKITFTGDVELVESRSGLPESNPDLNAKVEAGNTLTF